MIPPLDSWARTESKKEMGTVVHGTSGALFNYPYWDGYICKTRRGAYLSVAGTTDKDNTSKQKEQPRNILYF